jgi:hypothetical protein
MSRETDITAEVDLATDPFADDLTEQLAERAPRRLANRGTVVLGALVLLVAGFLAGAQVQKHWGTASTAQASNNPFGNFPRTGASGFPALGGQQQQAGGSATTGTVKLVDGNTVYIQTADGNTVTIKTSGTTSVQVSGSLKDLKAGATVSVEGQTGSDGSVTATRITKTK